MFSIQQPLLILHNIDGTLLDSHSYNWQPAAPLGSPVYAKQMFPSFSVAVKHQRKCCTLQKTLGLQGLPLIAENGAVIQLAERWQ